MVFVIVIQSSFAPIHHHTLCLNHKVRRMGMPETLFRALPRLFETRSRMTKQNDAFCVPMSFAEMSRKRFRCRVTRQYNSHQPN